MTHPSILPAYGRAFIVIILLSCILGAGCTDLSDWGYHSSLDQGTTGDLRAYFLDVGQGDSALILFKDKVILIDAGETDAGKTVVGDLKKLGVNKIDLVVATHPHSDHIGGMQDVLDSFPVEKVLDSGTPSSSTLYERFLSRIERENIPYLVAEPGQTIEIDPSLRILVLSPPKGRIGEDINTNSVVLRISYGTVNLLFTGDATTAAEEVMVKTGYPLDAQVIKIGHHGSSGSSSAAFLARVRPEVAVISLAADNPYGHPHEETMERLLAAGPQVFRTDRDGTILIRSNGAMFSVATANGDREIWATTVPSPQATATSVSLTIPSIPADIPVAVPSVTLPPVQIGNASWVRITAVNFDAPGDDRVNLNGEWVRITNTGDGSVLIAGWTLMDRSGSDPFTFPAVVMLPGESVTIYAGSGTMNTSALFMGRTEPLFGNSGDTAFLRDGSGTIIDRRSGDGSS